LRYDRYIDSDQKKISDGKVDQALILVKLRGDYSGYAVPHLVRFLKKFYRGKSEQALIKRVHRALDRLRDRGLVITQKIGTYRFARLTGLGLKAIPGAVDLIRKAGLPETMMKRVLEELLANQSVYRLLLMPLWSRVSEEWRFIARKLYPKPPVKYTSFDKELLTLIFETWKENVKRKVLVFVDENGEFHLKEYVTRFTDETYAKKLIVKYNYAWKKATEEYDEAVFVTITLPPVIPIQIQKYALSFLWHRMKAYLRKHYGFTPPHISVDEPQNNLSIHRHGVIFGIPRIMDKREFTRWLDEHLMNFFKDMGHHIKKTVNNRLTEEQVKALNVLGRKLLKKYLRYKRKHSKYRGPVNYLCKLVKRDNRWEWENPPPEYVKYDRKGKGDKKSKKSYISPSDYIKKYLIKNLNEILKGSKGDGSKSGVLDRLKLAWYWLTRCRFYMVSPKFRLKSEPKEPLNWRFVGVMTIGEFEGFLGR
jgi:hypothetical protein